VMNSRNLKPEIKNHQLLEKAIAKNDEKKA
jgi:hypothetical protein